MTAQYKLEVGHLTSQAPSQLQEERPLPFAEHFTVLISPLSTIQPLHLFLIHNAIVLLIYSLCAAF